MKPLTTGDKLWVILYGLIVARAVTFFDGGSVALGMVAFLVAMNFAILAYLVNKK